MTFSGLRRDIKTHIPFTGNKISVRADLMNTFWTKISAQVNEASFKRNRDKKSFAFGKTRTRDLQNSKHWLESNFIPMDSKKFGFRNFDYIIRYAIKNEPEIEKLRSPDPRIFREKSFFLKNPPVT